MIAQSVTCSMWSDILLAVPASAPSGVPLHFWFHSSTALMTSALTSDGVTQKSPSGR